MVEFDRVQDDEGEVVAYGTRYGYYFRSSEQAVTYRWIAEVNAEQAQRIAVEFGYMVSRVGLDEPEFVRKSRLGVG